MRKPIKPEYEGPVELPNGYLATDTGDTWHSYMPREFWTPEARRLFKAAEEAGIIVWCPETDRYLKGENLTKGQLAYWCKKASSYLGLDRGLETCWAPFERVFGTLPGRDLISGEPIKGSNPLRFTLHNLKESAGEDGAYRASIDDFFETLNNIKNE